MKKYINAILSIGTVCLLFYTLIDLKKQVKEVSVLKNQVDSLTTLNDNLVDEAFMYKVQNGRLELSLEHLKSVDPKAADEFENFYSRATE